jgi:hypothetical protein
MVRHRRGDDELALQHQPAPGGNLRSKQFRTRDPRNTNWPTAATAASTSGALRKPGLGDAGKPPDKFSHMSVYGWLAPLVNASKPDNEWQTMEGTIVANRISVTERADSSTTRRSTRSDERRGPQ